MQIKDRIFPYPILNHNKSISNYNDIDFIFNYEPVETESEFILKNATFTTESKLINDLLDKNLIKIELIIECSYTVYRKAFNITRNPRDIHLSKSDFYEKVSFSMYATATQNFKLQFEEVEDDYSNIEFEIEKYDILAANDGFTRNFIHDEKSDNLAQSIFSIVVNHDMNKDDSYIVECENSKKIRIVLPEEQYNYYKVIYTVPTYTEVFFNMLLVNALIEGLSLCKIDAITNPNDDLDDIGNKFMWFRSILNGYKKLKGIDLTIEEFKKCSLVKLAQELLGKPLGKALNKLVKETNGTEEEE